MIENAIIKDGVKFNLEEWFMDEIILLTSMYVIGTCLLHYFKVHDVGTESIMSMIAGLIVTLINKQKGKKK